MPTRKAEAAGPGSMVQLPTSGGGAELLDDFIASPLLQQLATGSMATNLAVTNARQDVICRCWLENPTPYYSNPVRRPFEGLLILRHQSRAMHCHRLQGQTRPLFRMEALQASATTCEDPPPKSHERDTPGRRRTNIP